MISQLGTMPRIPLSISAKSRLIDYCVLLRRLYIKAWLGSIFLTSAFNCSCSQIPSVAGIRQTPPSFFNSVL